MISPFMLYLVLMLDSINSALLVATIVSLMFLAINCFLVSNANDSDIYKDGWEDRKAARTKTCNKLSRRLAFMSAFCFVAATLLPNTKQAAAIIVIPAIANNEQVQAEAGELYNLAKQALANAAAPSIKKKTK